MDSRAYTCTSNVWQSVLCLSTAAGSLRAATPRLIWNDTNISTEDNVLTSVTRSTGLDCGGWRCGCWRGCYSYRYMFWFCYQLGRCLHNGHFSAEAMGSDWLRLWTSCCSRWERLPGLTYEGVCSTGRKFRETLRKVYYSFSLPSLYLPWLNFTRTCLSYRFHMIGSGAAYQKEERYQIKALHSRQG